MYAEKVLSDIDPQKTKTSYQLDMLKPCMEEIAKETNTPLEDIFIRYMDLASTQKVEMNNKMRETLKDAGVTDLNTLPF